MLEFTRSQNRFSSLTLRARQVLSCLFLLAVLCSCQSLPARDNIVPSYHFSQITESQLHTRADALVVETGAGNAFYPLLSAREALQARLQLIENATKSLDLQYYIWKTDGSGVVMAQAILAAAQRGVRVRILLDDWGDHAKDKALLVMNKHPNLDIRLYNPLSSRSGMLVSTMMEFSRINRRMHNKTCTADSAFTIVGGRNIADEYFNSDGPLAFADLDVLIAGAVVKDVEDGFDLFWNSQHSYPIELIDTRGVTNEEAVIFYDTLNANASAVILPEATSEFWLPERQNGWYPAEAEFLMDHPDKTGIEGSRKIKREMLADHLGDLAARVEQEMLLVSPYFVPGKNGVKALTDLAKRGVEVKILTNSLASTDSAAVYAGYAKYRRKLLEAGVKLYELRSDIVFQAHEDRVAKGNTDFAKASLHAKFFLFDKKHFFVGSLNLDPRSFDINTEVGLLMETERYTTEATWFFNQALRDNTYELKIDEKNNIIWLAYERDEEVVYTHSPNTSPWVRFKAWFTGLLPIESNL